MKRKKQEKPTDTRPKAKAGKKTAAKEARRLSLAVYLSSVNEVLDNFNTMLEVTKNHYSKLEDKNREELKLAINHFQQQSTSIIKQISEIMEQK